MTARAVAAPSTLARTCTWAAAAAGYNQFVLGSVLGFLAFNASRDANVYATLVSIAAALGAVGGASIFGVLVRRRGPRATLVALAAAAVVGALLCSFVRDVSLFILARLLIGVALGALLPSLIVIAAEPATPRTPIGILAGYLAGGVAGELGAFVIPAVGWRTLFVLGAVLIAVAVALVVRTLGQPTSGTTRFRPEETAASDGRERGPSRGIALVVAAFALALMSYGASTWLPEILRARLASDLWVLHLPLAGIGGVAGLLIAGALPRRIGPALAALWSLGAALVIVLLWAVSSPALLLAAMVALGFLTYGAQGVLYAAIARAYEGRMRIRWLAIVVAFGYTGALVGPVVALALLASGAVDAGSLLAFAGIAVVAAGALFGVRGMREGSTGL